MKPVTIDETQELLAGEGYVCGRVDVGEIFVELNAVNDLNRPFAAGLLLEEDVARMQVSVAHARLALAVPLSDEYAALEQERF